MSAQIFFRPLGELRVVDPHTGTPLPPDGTFVHYTEHATYWERRMQDKEVVMVVPPPAAAVAVPPGDTPSKPVKLVQTKLKDSA